MSDKALDEMSYEEKEQRLDEILERLDKSETPMDELASEAREAAQLIMSMQATLKSTRDDLTKVFADMDEQRAEFSSPAREEQDDGEN